MQTRFSTALLLLGVLSVAPALADDVYLTNGKTFEDVVAELTETQVRIRMPGGQLSLPRSQVLRVEKSDSGLGEYLRRKERIESGAPGAAREWLDLALWAKRNGLQHGVREASLKAAELEPRLDGLAPLLRGFGYVLDPDLERWITHEESMRRRGFVLADGEWITREEAAQRRRALEDELSRRRAERDAAQAARAARAAREAELALAELKLQREASRPAAPEYPLYPAYSYPVVVIPGFFLPDFPGHHPDPGKPHDGRVPGQERFGSNSFIRQPGSLIPGVLGTSSSGPR